MEDIPGLIIDPEEDEIFFYINTENGKKPICCYGSEKMQSHTSSYYSDSFDHNGHINNPAEINGEKRVEINAESTNIPLNEVPNITFALNEPNVPVDSVGSPRCKDWLHEIKSTSSNLIKVDSPAITCETNRCAGHVGNKRNTIESTQNRLSFHSDHTYSAPVRSMIDKSILKTPKSVVKADKDGGFLKVLSEISLIKAEADKSITLKEAEILTDIQGNQNNDDNKENHQSDVDSCNINIESTELMLLKVQQDPAEKLFTPQSIMKKISCIYPKELPVKSTDPLDLSKCRNNCAESLKNELVVFENINTCQNDLSFEDVKSLESNKSCKTAGAAPKENCSDESNDLEVMFEKMCLDNNDLRECQKEETVETLINQDCDLIQFGGSVCESHIATSKLDSKEVSLSEDSAENNDSEITSEGNSTETGGNKQVSEEIPIEYDVSSQMYEKKMEKTYLRRNTLKLFGELNEIAISEQAKKESTGGPDNIMLSKEAAKVIDKLKAIGIDDSICSPDQYLDLNHRNSITLGSDFSGILNNTVTNEDIELLLKNISSNSSEGKIVVENRERQPCGSLDSLGPGKKNIFPTPIKNKPSWNTTNAPLIFASSQNPTKTSTSVVMDKPPDVTATVQCSSGRCASTNGKVKKAVFQTTQVVHDRAKGTQIDQKNIKACVSKKVPKFTSASKSVEQNKAENNRATTDKTTLLKVQKSLKFSDVESPVQVCVRSKIPVVISKRILKGEAVSGFNACEERVGIKSKSSKLEVKGQPLQTAPSPVHYKNAISLKLDKSDQSRIPRLSPKSQKLAPPDSSALNGRDCRIPGKPLQTAGRGAGAIRSDNRQTHLPKAAAKII